MFAKSSFLLTTILSFIFMLLTSPLFAAAAPIPSPLALAAPAPVAMPQAHVPTSLMGRTIILRSPAAEAEAVEVNIDTDALPINRAERFALRMERARKLAWFNGFINIRSTSWRHDEALGGASTTRREWQARWKYKNESVYLFTRQSIPWATHFPRARI